MPMRISDCEALVTICAICTGVVAGGVAGGNSGVAFAVGGPDGAVGGS